MPARNSLVPQTRPTVLPTALLVTGLVILPLLGACSGPPPLTACNAVGAVTPVCEFQNPEDLVVDGSGNWLIVSQAPLEDSPGTLIAFRPADGRKQTLWPSPRTEASAAPSRGDATCPGIPDQTGFTPHGIDLSEDHRTLFVVNHGGREAVEIFSVGTASGVPSLTWRGCVLMPESAMMNDVAALPAAASGGDDFVVTQMSSANVSGVFALLGGTVSGEVFRWSAASGLRPIPGTKGIGPNGVEVAPDGGTVFFSEWVSRNLVRVALDGSGRSSVPLGFNPDNLTWTNDGRLLAAGQITSAVEVMGCFGIEGGTCAIASAAATIHPTTLEVKRIWTHDPATATGAASVALEHKGKIWIGTFSGDRLAWFDKPAP
ncbi:MAG: hypothetical protein VX246_03220 [Myxococcota bacterium]|nr:hypothetical protein [Myxococcota bacterium]